jgi:hypothetical protein
MASAAVIALIGGTVLRGASAASRTTSALPQFRSGHGYDLDVIGAKPIPNAFSKFPTPFSSPPLGWHQYRRFARCESGLLRRSSWVSSATTRRRSAVAALALASKARRLGVVQRDECDGGVTA